MSYLLLWNFDRFFFLFQSQLIYGWSISILLLTVALLAPAKMGNIDYKYNPYDAAFYAAFSPMSWCTIFAWIIFTTHIGHTSKNSHEIHLIGNINIFFQLFLAIVSNILSCRLFLITTRIAYAVYLTQFPIFFYNVGTTRHSGYYSFLPSMVIIFKYIPFLILTLIVVNFF